MPPALPAAGARNSPGRAACRSGHQPEVLSPRSLSERPPARGPIGPGVGWTDHPPSGRMGGQRACPGVRPMKLAGLLDAALGDPALAAARDLAARGDTERLDLTAPAALRPFVVAAAAGTRPALAVAAPSREAEDLAAALGCLLPADEIAVYPSWETLPHERLSPRSDTVGRRLAVLRRLAHPELFDTTLRVVVAPVRSVLQPQLKGLGDLEPVELHQGGEADLEPVVRQLADMAYARVDLVEKRGEFAVRGGILDVFPPTEEHPLRVEFWGDEVEEIRSFAVADQRTIAPVERLWAPPCRELLLTPQVRARAAALAEQHPALRELLDKLAGGIPVEGMESLAPVLVPGDLELVLHVLPENTVVLLCDPERIRTRAHDLVRTSDEFLEASWAAAAVGGKAPIDLGAAAFRSLADVRAAAGARGQAWWSVSPFGTVEAPSRPEPEPWEDEVPEVSWAGTWAGPAGRRLRDAPDEGRALALSAQPVPLYHGDTGRVLSDLKRWTGDGWRVALVFAGHGPAQRSVEVLRDAGFGVSLADSVAEPPPPGLPVVTTGGLEFGFVDEASRLAVVTGTDVSGGSAPSTAPSANTSSSSTPRASAASPATGCSCRPTSSTSSPGTSVGRRRPCTSSAARTGPSRRRAPARRYARSRPSSSSSTPRGRTRRATHSGRIRRGSASWRTRSRTPRRPTSSPRSRKSRWTWRSRYRWTG